MQSINDAFEGLRTHIPTLPYEKRLSKVLPIIRQRYLSPMSRFNEDSLNEIGGHFEVGHRLHQLPGRAGGE